MADAHDFLLDSVFCEYAYIVNLDDMTLEFYGGFNDKKFPAGVGGRYAAMQQPPIKRADGTIHQSEYYGVVLMDAILLADLPKTKRCKMFVNKTIGRWSKLCHEAARSESENFIFETL
jgi:hypothetical protein